MVFECEAMGARCVNGHLGLSHKFCISCDEQVHSEPPCSVRVKGATYRCTQCDEEQVVVMGKKSIQTQLTNEDKDEPEVTITKIIQACDVSKIFHILKQTAYLSIY